MSEQSDFQRQRSLRRDFLKLSWGIAGAVALGESIFVGLKFLSPRVAEGEFGSVINAGAVDQFPTGSVTPFNAGRFFLVRLPDGGFLALHQRCTHLGCAVPYDPVSGQFVCPCHGSAFTMDGQVLNPPAPRPLDQFPIVIEEGAVMVDTGAPFERDTSEPPRIVYAGGGES
jgi:cytochrome b6-f complex iron-sulfur subunit